MRGKSLALYLVVDAADGYRAVFALPELDSAFTDQVIILADRRDGKALSEAEGQWRVVVPSEKRQARWVRQVVSPTIRRALKSGNTSKVVLPSLAGNMELLVGHWNRLLPTGQMPLTDSPGKVCSCSILSNTASVKISTSSGV